MHANKTKSNWRVPPAALQFEMKLNVDTFARNIQNYRVLFHFKNDHDAVFRVLLERRVLTKINSNSIQ